MTWVITRRKGEYLERFKEGQPVWTQDVKQAAKFTEMPWETLTRLGYGPGKIKHVKEGAEYEAR